MNKNILWSLIQNNTQGNYQIRDRKWIYDLSYNFVGYLYLKIFEIEFYWFFLWLETLSEKNITKMNGICVW